MTIQALKNTNDYTDPKIEKAWASEIEYRVNEIESGEAKGIPAKTMVENTRRELNAIIGLRKVN